MAGRIKRRMRRRMMRLNPVASSIMEAFETAFMNDQVTLSLNEMPNLLADFTIREEAQIDNRIKAQGVTPTNALVDHLGLVAYTLDQGDPKKALRSMVRMAQQIKSEEEAAAFITQVDTILAAGTAPAKVAPPKPKAKVKAKVKVKVKAPPKPERVEESDDYGLKNLASSSDQRESKVAKVRSGLSTSSGGTYELSNSELVRLAIYRRSNARQRETYGKFFLFLQFGKRTKPIPTVDVWLRAIDVWGSKNRNIIQSTPMLTEVFEDVSYQNPALRQNLFVLYRPYRKSAPTQFYVPSLNATYSNDGKDRLVFSPASEFVSRLDIVPGSVLPSDLKKAYLGYTELERDSREIQRIGKADEEMSVTSIYQMAEAIGLMQSNKPWRKRREKYQAYGVFYFEEDEKGRIQMRKYFDPPRPALMPLRSASMNLTEMQLGQLPNPRRNRRRTRRLMRHPRRF